MPRKTKHLRKQDTRLTFKQICKLLGINTRQRVILGRYLRNEVDITDDKTSQ